VHHRSFFGHRLRKCTLSNDTTFFVVFLLMHTTANIKIAAGKTGTETVVRDDDYSFQRAALRHLPD
jgi:hypothetical protein